MLNPANVNDLYKTFLHWESSGVDCPHFQLPVRCAREIFTGNPTKPVFIYNYLFLQLFTG
jgi:hypothetical protein